MNAHPWFAGVLAALVLASAVCGVEPIKPKDFQSLHALIKPHPSEDRFTEIPWLTSLWEARRKAAAEGKPILLWEMDGNPLGCV